MEIPICEQFLSFQGEGNHTGRISYFIRTAGCNLDCTWCDSRYALKRGKKTSVDKLIADVEDQPGSPIIVVTGGEPLLYQKELSVVLGEVYTSYNTEVETNGTIVPSVALQNVVSQFNVSPKLASSGNKLEKSINMDALEELDSISSIFKFVVKTQKDFDQMEELIEKIDCDADDIWVMPEGRSFAAWRANALKLVDRTLERGYNLSPRLQVALWENKKGV